LAITEREQRDHIKKTRWRIVVQLDYFMKFQIEKDSLLGSE